MGRTDDHNTTEKFRNKRSFDGKPVEPGKVLVPFIKETFNLPAGTYIQDNFTVMYLGEFEYEIGYMPISESFYVSYMKEFWDEIEKDSAIRREERCIIGKNPDETDELCPVTKSCKNCACKGLLDRHDPNHVDIISLDYEYENEEFDIEDTDTPSVEDQVINAIEPEPMENELQLHHDAVCSCLKLRYCRKDHK